ncbi:MAG: lipase family protein [Planctomycetota bacterium]
MPKIIQDIGERPLVLHSEVRDPLADASELQRALVFAELSMISYNDQEEANRAANAIGFSQAELLEHDGAQAIRFANEHDCVIACRGTEPNEWNDVQADAKASLAVVGTIGKVHTGFNQEVEDLWPLLEKVLRQNKHTLWFCGHSLGGAIATICAIRCELDSSLPSPQELHTFGSPRVGCRRYVENIKVKHRRWVHNNDIVTRVPPVWMGFRHCGDEIYLDRFGKIRDISGVFRSRDRWRGLLQGLLNWKLDFLSDHSIHAYAGHIAKAADAEKSGESVAADDLENRLGR